MADVLTQSGLEPFPVHETSAPDIRRAHLPEKLWPWACNDLLRLGRDHDGGYLVSASDLNPSRLLLSFGLNDDWSFERDFYKMTGADITACDGSVSLRHFLRRLRDTLPANPFVGDARRHLGNGSLRTDIWQALKVVVSYLLMFRKGRRHLVKFVAEQSGDDRVSFRDLCVGAPIGSTFLKIDIEGGEYAILEQILEAQALYSGLVIEFHDCETELSTILDFVTRLDLTLVHAHANNCAPVGPSGIPTVLELTFSRAAPRLRLAPALPHVLDMDNTETQSPIHLTRAPDKPGPSDAKRGFH